MSDQFTVVTRDLATHAHAVDQVGDRVREATEAGHSIRAGVDAYGKICGFLPPLLNGAQDILVQGISDCVDDMRDTALKLRTTADLYDSADAGSARNITDAGHPL